MRLVFWAERFWPFIGGVEVNISDLIDPLRSRGYEILVLTAMCGQDFAAQDDFRGARVERIEMGQPLVDRDLAAVAGVRARIGSILRDFDPHVIHYTFTFSLSTFFVQGPARAANAPMVVTVPGIVPMKSGMGEMLRGLTGIAEAVVAPSVAVADELRRMYPDAADRVEPVLNGLAVPSRPTVPLPAENVILCAGRLSREKGYDLAIRAVAALPERLAARLVIAGEGVQGEGLHALADELGVADRVTFAGWIEPPDIWDLIDSAAAVLVPSREMEGFGLIAAEASLRERPVVAACTGGLVEVIEEGVSGTFFEIEDVPGLTDAITRVLDQRAAWAERGPAMRAHAEREFTVERQAGELDDLYRRLCARASSGLEPVPEARLAAEPGP